MLDYPRPRSRPESAVGEPHVPAGPTIFLGATSLILGHHREASYGAADHTGAAGRANWSGCRSINGKGSSWHQTIITNLVDFYTLPVRANHRLTRRTAT